MCTERGKHIFPLRQSGEDNFRNQSSQPHGSSTTKILSMHNWHLVSFLQLVEHGLINWLTFFLLYSFSSTHAYFREFIRVFFSLKSYNFWYLELRQQLNEFLQNSFPKHGTCEMLKYVSFISENEPPWCWNWIVLSKMSWKGPFSCNTSLFCLDWKW